MARLRVSNRAISGILIHKTDSTTGEGLYGVSFILYDSTNTPIGQYTSDDRGYRRTKAAEAALPAASAELTEWKEDVLYQLLEKVTVLDEARIKVTFRSGVEIEQALEKDERSVTA